MSNAVFGPGHVVAGRYRIEQLLGQGGMGSVYRAEQLSVGRSVALKLLMDEHVGSAALLERFQREAFALARLAHENTVRLFDFGTSERGCPFLVMELLRGADLACDLERFGPLRYDQALAIVRQILSSLAEAHDAGIVHRDVKPANIFLCVGNDGVSPLPFVKVLDFGIVGGVGVEAAAPRLTRTGTVVGSTAYMSPEQAQGLSVGPASDLYAVGVVLFEMLTQRTLFDERPVTAQLLAKVLENAPQLRGVRPDLDVPAEVEVLVAQLLARDPSERPRSARTVIERIDGLLLTSVLPPLVRPVAGGRANVAPVSGPTLSGVAGPGVHTLAATLAFDSSATPNLPKTVPMLVPYSEGSGWAPRPSDGFPRVPPRRGAHSRVAVALTLLGTAALGALAGPLRSTSAGQTVAAALAPFARMLSAALPGEGARAQTARARAAAPFPGLVEEVALVAVQPPPGAAAALAANPSAGGGLEPLEQPTELEPSAAEPGVSSHAATGQDVLESSVAQAETHPAPPPAAPPSTKGPSLIAKPPVAKPPVAKPPVAKPPVAKPPVAKPPVAKPSVAKPSVSIPSVAKGPVSIPPVSNPLPSPGLESASAMPGTASPTIAPHPGASVSPDSIVSPAPNTGASSIPQAPAPVPLEPPSELDRPAAPPVTLTPAPELRGPSREPARREYRRWSRPHPLSSVAAVEAAYRAGEITWAERNELVTTLRELETDARARAMRAYGEGRISRRELRLRQRAIDREFGGEPPYPERRGRIRLRW